MLWLIPLLVLAGSVVLLGQGIDARRQPALDAERYLQSLDLDEEEYDQFEVLLREPFLSRVMRPLGARVLDAVARLTPRAHVDRVHEKLILAGLQRVKAEEFVTAQVLGVALTIVAAVAWVTFGEPNSRYATLALLGGPVLVGMGFQSWLERKISERQDSIRKELADVLDLLAISVEAGTGFEGAVQIVVENFDSPLSMELSRTLKEMELGLSRREALQNLKRRTEVAELSNFVLVLTQADALGMPIGRVLKAQAAEMRLKRRQWAREQAAKLPVKILFPLVLFIFPAVLVVVLGPAGASITGIFEK